MSRQVERLLVFIQPRHSMYAIFTYIGVMPEGSMGRQSYDRHGVFGPLVSESAIYSQSTITQTLHAWNVCLH